MPKIHVMHENGCEPAGKFAYTGRTIRTLGRRLSGHVCAANTGHTSKVYQHMRERGPENFVITLLEDFEETIEGDSEFKELWW